MYLGGSQKLILYAASLFASSSTQIQEPVRRAAELFSDLFRGNENKIDTHMEITADPWEEDILSGMQEEIDVHMDTDHSPELVSSLDRQDDDDIQLLDSGMYWNNTPGEPGHEGT